MTATTSILVTYYNNMCHLQHMSITTTTTHVTYNNTCHLQQHMSPTTTTTTTHVTYNNNNNTTTTTACHLQQQHLLQQQEEYTSKTVLQNLLELMVKGSAIHIQMLHVCFDVLPRLSELLLGGAVLNKVFQPHEAHIPYLLQVAMSSALIHCTGLLLPRRHWCIR